MNTVSITIPVAVNTMGDWIAAGDPISAGNSSYLQRMVNGLSHVVYITAEIPVPQMIRVDGLVSADASGQEPCSGGDAL